MECAISGHVTGGIETPPAVLPHVQTGRVRALAVAGPARLPSLPDVPTTAEVGLPEVQIIAWFGLVAPAGTPPEIVQKINAEVTGALKSADIKERFAKLPIRPSRSTPAEMIKLTQEDRVKWGKVVKDAGIRLE
jgi:tripartite-type tricarboxylate transporter receptor subunit TctC